MNVARRPGIFKRFIGGLFSPLRALRFLFAHPGLLKYAIFPTIINVILVTALFLFGARLSHRLVDRIVPQQDLWYWIFATYALQFVLFVTLIFFGVLIFYILAGIICVPFNEVLSQKTELICQGKPKEEGFSIRLLLKDILTSIANEIKRSGILLLLLAVLLVVWLIPIVGKPISLIFGNFVTMLFLAYDNLDYPLSRRRLPFSVKWRFILRHLPSTLGFGAGALISVVVPFLNFVVIPLTVVGATMLFCEIEEWSGKMPDMTPTAVSGQKRNKP
jgi:CysZ protein